MPLVFRMTRPTGIVSNMKRGLLPAASLIHTCRRAAPAVVTSQDLMAQFTPDDADKIRAAVEENASFWLLWSALQVQGEPMAIASPRFLAGWSALVTILGQVRMSQIATALGAKSLVA